MSRVILLASVIAKAMETLLTTMSARFQRVIHSEPSDNTVSTEITPKSIPLNAVAIEGEARIMGHLYILKARWTEKEGQCYPCQRALITGSITLNQQYQ